MESYSVLLKSESNVPAPTLATELAKILERPAGELTRALRQHPWILIEHVDATALDEVFEALGREGVVAKAVPDIHMPKLRPALRVRDADPVEKGLFLKVAEPPSPPVLPWDEIRLIAVGEATLAAGEEGQIYGAWKGGGGTPAASRGPTSTPGSAGLGPAKQSSKSPLLMGIITGGENPMTLAIDAGNFNYEFLKKRMKPTSRENLKLLLKAILARRPDIPITDRTRGWLEGEPASSYRFRSLKAFGVHIRWVLQGIEEREAEEA
jgi:hypothetical protein